MKEKSVEIRLKDSMLTEVNDELIRLRILYNNEAEKVSELKQGALLHANAILDLEDLKKSIYEQFHQYDDVIKKQDVTIANLMAAAKQDSIPNHSKYDIPEMESMSGNAMVIILIGGWC